ncbi:DUF6482 family protein [Alkalimonas delamerensis]|uniref:DUF6482 family protein n=1 Tax=Alkalimonas delamerensis TaxID=265981 RepID=A0ABT9GMT7_9GAMM|nr:DUF6482 family protein [Alkalimonas delamerensis]MDP4528291.1 DUF6482 family protein [Alkalimonas delamerensis]
MNFHRIEHLNRQDVQIDELVVHSYEMGLYLAEVDFDQRKAFIIDDETGRPKKFHSIEQVKDAFGDATIRKAYLCHQSAYDEMVGAADKTDNTLKVPLFGSVEPG